MSLDPAYLQYARRRYGMDHDLYPWSNLFERAAPDLCGRRVGVVIVVNVEWFPITPADKPFRAPGHMQTTYPDYRHYTSREYGTRVGLYRFLDAFAARGIRASFAVNAAIAERYPALVADIVAGGHEVVAHSTDMNGTIATGVPEDEERALIAASLDTLEKIVGKRPRGWMSIARSQSWNTPRLLAEAGLGYMCDWVNDDLPVRFATAAGSIVNVPVNHELSDRQIITVQQQSADSYVQQMQDATMVFEREAARFGARMLALNVTPYIMGLPYRIAAFERLLDWLVARDEVGFLTTGEVADATSD
ncbi:polysaccharide deacetylase family protein [Sphingomonas montanisoli]|uniref:Chitooligosaccharide deacetylase n=1 Tax=Sphingomonas montanisoli TaxID=2606412 RepID=A0A5D9C6X6_9SPHN|nr:polysaccharide deacetylase family protein [Sphingomonas montanisoli]TZG27213.1 polysaccharide deacetylase family protein [Sphingomonas montanisoli]